MIFMERMTCSLCGKKKESAELDMDDFVFGNYVKFMRGLGLSSHKGALGICKDDMADYQKIKKNHQSKMVLYGTLAVVFSIIYLYFTSNIIVSMIVILFVFGMSIFSYAPPLKKS
jgi:hypothetical protein